MRYGDAYTVSKTRQAYQQAAGQVNDGIPELQSAACGRHCHEVAGTKDTSRILRGLENAPCDRYRSKKDREYSHSWSAIADARYDDETAYNRSQGTLADALANSPIWECRIYCRCSNSRV